MQIDRILSIELVPSTVWFQSIHNYLKSTGKGSDWTKIKENLFVSEGKKCWICGDENNRLEAHEFWEYDDVNRIQKLTAIHHLCSNCHKIKHFGFWCYTEEGRQLLEKSHSNRANLVNHFCKINNCTAIEFEDYWINTYEVWKERSKYDWTQDWGIYQDKKEK